MLFYISSEVKKRSKYISLIKFISQNKICIQKTSFQKSQVIILYKKIFYIFQLRTFTVKLEKYPNFSKLAGWTDNTQTVLTLKK